MDSLSRECCMYSECVWAWVSVRGKGKEAGGFGSPHTLESRLECLQSQLVRFEVIAPSAVVSRRLGWSQTPSFTTPHRQKALLWRKAFRHRCRALPWPGESSVEAEFITSSTYIERNNIGLAQRRNTEPTEEQTQWNAHGVSTGGGKYSKYSYFKHRLCVLPVKLRMSL